MKRKWSGEEVRQWYARHSTITYANGADANVVVRKPKGLGWTVNWANPQAYFLQAVILAAAFGLLTIVQS